MRIITISREFGSGGREVGKRLADALGFAYYDTDYGKEYRPKRDVKVIKKDGTKEAFNVQKVINAVGKSAYRALTRFTDEEKRKICSYVIEKVDELESDEIPIPVMHNVVESALEQVKPIVAKSYRDYRNYKQDFVRMLDDVYKKSQSIMYIGDKENSNTDSALVSTKRSLIFNQLNKELYQKFFMTTEEIQACRDGYIYVHDMSARRDTMNCCLFDVEHVLSGGFEMGNIWYNEPKTLDVAFDVIGDIVLSAASQQYGGFTVPSVDLILEPYAQKSYDKYLKKYMEMGVPEEKAQEVAWADVVKEMEQGFQGWEYKFNTVASSRGDYPFITVTAGTGTGRFAKLATISMLNVRRKGQGKEDHKKPVLFPKIVFLYDENLHGPGKPLDQLGGQGFGLTGGDPEIRLKAPEFLKVIITFRCQIEVIHTHLYSGFAVGQHYMAAVPQHGTIGVLADNQTVFQVAGSIQDDLSRGRGDFSGQQNQQVVMIDPPVFQCIFRAAVIAGKPKPIAGNILTICVAVDPGMQNAFGAACVRTQIQHGDRLGFEFLGPVYSGPLIVFIEIVELEHRDAVRLPQVCILVLRQILVIQFPGFSRQCLGGAVGIMNGQLFVTDVIFKLRLPVKYGFFQQHWIINDLPLLGNGTLEQIIQVCVIFHGLHRFAIDGLVAVLRFQKGSLTEEKRNLCGGWAGFVDPEMPVFDKAQLTDNDLFQLLTGEGVFGFQSLQHFLLGRIKGRVSAEVVIKTVGVIKGIEQVVDILHGLAVGQFQIGVIVAARVGDVSRDFHPAFIGQAGAQIGRRVQLLPLNALMFGVYLVQQLLQCGLGNIRRSGTTSQRKKQGGAQQRRQNTVFQSESLLSWALSQRMVPDDSVC